jgi:hypothetical protein
VTRNCHLSVQQTHSCVCHRISISWVGCEVGCCVSLYRLEIQALPDLHREAEAYRQIFNHTRPHEALGLYRPIEVHRNPTLKPQPKITNTQPSAEES